LIVPFGLLPPLRRPPLRAGSDRRGSGISPLSPAIEIYGDAGMLGGTPCLSRQQLLVGPVAVGVLKLNALGLGHAGDLKYEVGWLFGATPATASGVLRWRLELDIPF